MSSLCVIFEPSRFLSFNTNDHNNISIFSHLETFRSYFNQAEHRWSLLPSFMPFCALGKDDLMIYMASRCSRELLRFSVSFLASHCFTSSWLSSDCTAAARKDGRTKSRIGMFFLIIRPGQREHWRSIWPEAVLKPDHRHKLTTCVLVHKPDKLPRLGGMLRFPRQDLYRKNTNTAGIKYCFFQ